MKRNFENRLFLGNYNEVIPYKGSFAAFNKINGALILLDPNNIEQVHDGRWALNIEDEDTLQYLKQNDFLLSDEYVQNLIRQINFPHEDYSDVTLVISLTELCNCSCKYCYQLGWSCEDSLPDDKYTEWIIEYVKKIVEKAPSNGHLTIKYFGGEPLLKLKTIAVFNRKIEDIIYRINPDIILRYELDSNCTLLTRDVFSIFSNLSIATTLTLPHDHNALRGSTFKKIIENLASVSNMFEMPQYRLNIGYNMHHGNADDFEQFLIYIHKTGLKCNVYVTNIVNYPQTNFVNHLSDDEFEIRYFKQIVPLLLKYGYSVDLLPPIGLYRKCNGINTLTRKFFSNGTQVLCSFIPKAEGMLSTNYPNSIIPTSYLNPLPEMCIKCYDFPCCGGIRPCFQCSGSYPHKESIKKRIQLYLDTQNGDDICTDI